MYSSNHHRPKYNSQVINFLLLASFPLHIMVKVDSAHLELLFFGFPLAKIVDNTPSFYILIQMSGVELSCTE